MSRSTSMFDDALLCC